MAVGPQPENEIAATRVRKLGGATVLPGLVGLHVHFLGCGQLGSAVTTVRDLRRVAEVPLLLLVRGAVVIDGVRRVPPSAC